MEIMNSEGAGWAFPQLWLFLYSVEGSIWGFAGWHKMTTFYRVAVWGMSFSLWITKQEPHSAVTGLEAWTPASPSTRGLLLCRARVPLEQGAPPGSRVGTCRHMSAPRVFLGSLCDWWQQRCPFTGLKDDVLSSVSSFSNLSHLHECFCEVARLDDCQGWDFKHDDLGQLAASPGAGQTRTVRGVSTWSPKIS